MGQHAPARTAEAAPSYRPERRIKSFSVDGLVQQLSSSSFQQQLSREEMSRSWTVSTALEHFELSSYANQLYAYGRQQDTRHAFDRVITICGSVALFETPRLHTAYRTSASPALYLSSNHNPQA